MASGRELERSANRFVPEGITSQLASIPGLDQLGAPDPFLSRAATERHPMSAIRNALVRREQYIRRMAAAFLGPGDPPPGVTVVNDRVYFTLADFQDDSMRMAEFKLKSATDRTIEHMVIGVDVLHLENGTRIRSVSMRWDEAAEERFGVLRPPQFSPAGTECITFRFEKTIGMEIEIAPLGGQKPVTLITDEKGILRDTKIHFGDVVEMALEKSFPESFIPPDL